MSRLFGKTDLTPIAVDFGLASMKVLQLERGDEIGLWAAASLETPAELLEDDRGRLSFQASSLPELLKSGGFRGKRAVCSVSALHTVVQNMQIQRVPGVTLEAMAAQQAGEASGHEPGSLIVRAFEIGEITRGGHKCTEVLCVAIPRGVVMAHMTALRGARLRPVGVHSEHLAAMRSFDPITRRESDVGLTSVYIDLGYGTTNLVIAQGREMVYAKTIGVAGRTFDASLAERDGCSAVEARRRRCEFGLMPRFAAATSAVDAPAAVGALAVAGEDAEASADRRVGATPNGMCELPADADSGAREPFNPAATMDALTDELSMCLRYHRALFPERSIGRAVFVGGESRQLDVCKHVARSLRLPAQIADPLTPLRRCRDRRVEGLDLSQPQPGWAVPFGLCLSPTDL